MRIFPGKACSKLLKKQFSLACAEPHVESEERIELDNYQFLWFVRSFYWTYGRITATIRVFDAWVICAF